MCALEGGSTAINAGSSDCMTPHLNSSVHPTEINQFDKKKTEINCMMSAHSPPVRQIQQENESTPRNACEMHDRRIQHIYYSECVSIDRVPRVHHSI